MRFKAFVESQRVFHPGAPETQLNPGEVEDWFVFNGVDPTRRATPQEIADRPFNGGVAEYEDFEDVYDLIKKHHLTVVEVHKGPGGGGYDAYDTLIRGKANDMQAFAMEIEQDDEASSRENHPDIWED